MAGQNIQGARSRLTAFATHPLYDQLGPLHLRRYQLVRPDFLVVGRKDPRAEP
jgi:hypothetical protein